MKHRVEKEDIPYVIPVAGLLGAALRLWQLTGGRDEKGLFIDWHLSGLGLLVLAVAMVWFLKAMTRSLREETGSWEFNFPASAVGAAGTVLAALGLGWTGIAQLRSAGMAVDQACGVLGIVAALGLLVAAYGRLRGVRTVQFAHIPACIFFVVWLFSSSRLWGAETELWQFLPELAAGLSMMLAVYQRTAFDVDLGRRDRYLFWNQMAVWLCIAAAPGSEDVVLLLTGAVWMMTNLCALDDVIPEQKTEDQELAPEASEEDTEEI